MQSLEINKLDPRQSPYPIVEILTRKPNKSARVYVVMRDSDKLVYKVWKDDNHRYIAEGTAYQLGLSFAPKLIDIGPNWILIEFLSDYEQIGYNVFRMFKLRDAKKTFKNLKDLHNKGYSLLDFHPRNVMVNKDGNVKFVDFEHLYKYIDGVPKFEKSPAILGDQYFEERGCRREWRGADPNLHKKRWLPNYKKTWFDRVGVPLEDLLSKPDWILQLRRIVYVMLVRIPGWIRRRAGLGFVLSLFWILCSHWLLLGITEELWSVGA